MKKSFENWLWEDLEGEFGISSGSVSELHAWLNNQEQISLKEREQLQSLSLIFNAHYEDWNEDEIKMQFIAPLLAFINYYDTGLTPFSQRNLTATIGKWQIYGRVDWVLASGRQIPKKPYLFIHEYKPEKGRTNDPKGQLLAEMLVAQAKNNDEKCIYGVYIVGKDWYFTVLKGKHYQVSRPYQANEDHDLDIIFKALKEIKNIIKQP
ncbi:MAG: hypothetical protein OHK0038_23950 [Flammeovirgaceae bacterium]